MSRTVKCPHCLENLEIPDSLLNNEVRCALCQSTFVARESGRSEPTPTVGRADYDPYEERLREEEPRRRRQRSAPRRNNTWVWVLVLGCFGCCILGCGGLVWVTKSVAFPEFEPYTSKTGNYQAVFPGTPTEFDQPNKLAVDNLEHVAQVTRRWRDRYTIRYLDLPPKSDPNAILKKAADQLAAAIPGSIENSRIDTTSQSYPTIEIEITHPDTTTTLGKLIVADDRLYIVTLTAPNTSLEDPRAMEYFPAFEITAAGE